MAKLIVKKSISFLSLLNTSDKQITKHIKELNLNTRTSKSNGLWCCVLLPTICNLYLFQYSVSPLYKLIALLSIGLSIYSLLFIILLSSSNSVLKEPVYGGILSTSLISALLIYTSLDHGLCTSLFYSIWSVFMYSWLIRLSLMKFQNTFTLGEVMILTQGIVLLMISIVAQLSCNRNETDEEIVLISSVIYIVWTTLGLIITALYLLTEQQRNIKSLCCILGICTVFALVALHIRLGVNIIYKLLYYIFVENNRGRLILFWGILVGMSVMVLAIRTQTADKASTGTRKAFHLLASLVFMSGILLDINLMNLAGGIAFGLLILLEALRKSKIDPISSTLQSVFDVYSDEKDNGCFAVTPLYLYIGLVCPLILTPRGAPTLDRLAGVLSVGVGDSAASFFGSNYGSNKWPGSNRTYEGTLFNILSQVAMVYALLLLGVLDSRNTIIRTTLAAVVTSLVEAKTNQVDNLVLPLVTIVGFQLTWHLS
ncbi:hypothetical protein ACJJTC_017909 [Scirpophaga incertulas]